MHKSFLLIVLLYTMNTLFAMPQYRLEAVEDGYQIQLQIPSLQCNKELVTRKLHNGTVLNETFYRISIPGFANTVEKGKPELMKSAFKLAIEDEIPLIQVTDILVDRITLAHKVYPSQGPIWYSAPASGNLFYIDEKYYKSEGETSPYVSLSSPFTIRGQKGVSVIVDPVTYNPKENTLTVARSFTVTFKMKKPVCVKSLGSKLYDTYLRKIFQNLKGELGASVRSSESREKEDYLALVADRYEDNEDFKRWVEFRQKSCNVEVVPVSEAGSSKEEIREFIKGKLPTFMTFVGMYTDFPHYIGTQTVQMDPINTYLNYTTVVGNDTKPDISLGLFFVRSEQNLKNLVNKTIHTETHLKEMGNGYLCWAGNTLPNGPLPATHVETLFDELEQDYWTPGGFDTKKVYIINPPIGYPETALNYLNEGLRFFNYNGHGYDRGWAYAGSAYTWTTTSAPGEITNTVYPFVFSMCCLNGKFTLAGSIGCWAEYWIGHEKLGTTYVGSTQLSSINQHGMNRGFGIAIVDREITKMGFIYDFAKEYTFDSITIQNFALVGAEEYHLFGDPAIETMKEENTAISIKTVEQGAVYPELVQVLPHTMTIAIPKEGLYTVYVRSVNGRLLSRMVRKFTMGKHQLKWDGCKLGSQVCLVTIRGNGLQSVNKIVLQKL